jgi:hypothetical protein
MRQFSHIFSQVEGSSGALPSAARVATMAAALGRAVEEAQASAAFRLPTLAATQVFFQTKLREPDPMEAAVAGFVGVFAIGDEGMRHEALTEQCSPSALARAGAAAAAAVAAKKVI